MVQAGFAEEAASSAVVAVTSEAANAEIVAMRDRLHEIVSDPMSLIMRLNSNAAEEVKQRVLNEFIEREGTTLRDMVDELSTVRDEVYMHFEEDFSEELHAAVEEKLDPIIANIRATAVSEVQSTIGGRTAQEAYDRATRTSTDFVMWIKALVRRSVIYNSLNDLPSDIVFELLSGVDAPCREGVKAIVSWGAQRVRGRVSRVQAMNVTLPWLGRALLAAGQEDTTAEALHARREMYANAVITTILNAILS